MLGSFESSSAGTAEPQHPPLKQLWLAHCPGFTYDQYVLFLSSSSPSGISGIFSGFFPDLYFSGGICMSFEIQILLVLEEVKRGRTGERLVSDICESVFRKVIS